ncbi:MAG: hypothetical protein K9K75_06955, partial [Deltaproteobacteria bacterium]|nr:hypothetical protein [Deltaproteobacteria bacterium]
MIARIVKRIRLLVLSFLLIVVLAIVAVYGVIIYQIATLADDKAQSIALISAAIARNVDYAERTFTLKGLTPAFVFSQMKIMETNGGEFLTATSAV